MITTLLTVKITNNSDHSLKLYSLFPGSRDTNINDLVHIKSGIYKDEFVNGDYGVYGIYENDQNNRIKVPQFANQYVTFRIKDVHNGQNYYQSSFDEENPIYSSNYISSNKDYICYKDLSNIGSEVNFAFMYPVYINEKYLCLDSDSIGSYKLLNPGDYINIPIAFEYRLKANNSPAVISKTMSFDIRTSLYSDPITYTFKVTAKAINTTQDKVISANSSLLSKYNIVYK
jgi:hypothetical protein